MNKFRKFIKIGHIAGITLLLTLSNIVLAQDDNDQEGTSNGDWEFALAPLFIWGMGISGETTMGDSTAPLNVQFKDVFSNLDAIFTLHFEARKDKWTIFSEIQYANIGPDIDASLGPVSIDAGIGFKNTMFELGGAYAFRETQNTRWELLGGIRYTDQDVKVDGIITLPPPVNERDIDIRDGDSWSHAIVGTRFTGIMSNEWTFIARTDIGYGGSDNKAFNASALFDYRFNNWGSAFVGYRYLKYDYDNGKSEGTYAYDAYQSGPTLGVQIHW